MLNTRGVPVLVSGPTGLASELVPALGQEDKLVPALWSVVPVGQALPRRGSRGHLLAKDCVRCRPLSGTKPAVDLPAHMLKDAQLRSWTSTTRTSMFLLREQESNMLHVLPLREQESYMLS